MTLCSKGALNLPLENNKSIALLIDADNASSKFIQKILTELASYGKVNIRRAYGNWASTNLNGWQAIIQDHAIQPRGEWGRVFPFDFF